MPKRLSVAPLFGGRRAWGGPPPDPDMHVGRAGQWAYDLDDRSALLRSLVTNTLNDTFYVGRRELAREFASLCLKLANEDPEFVAKATVWASTEGRALNNTAPNVALAALASVKTKDALDWYARAFSHVIRTPLHLLEHIELLRKGGLGRQSLGRRPKRLVQDWLNDLSPYHAVKYHSRADLRDVLRMTHPLPKNAEQRDLFSWLVKNEWGGSPASPVSAYRRAKIGFAEGDETEALAAVETGRLPWEAVLPLVPRPSPAVWTALVRQMPYGALLRNLSAVSRHAVLPQELVEYVATRLTKKTAIEDSRVLPFQIHSALTTYKSGGRGGRSRLGRVFTPQPRIVAALEEALDLSLSSFRISGSVAVICDVSGSMVSGYVSRGLVTHLDAAGLLAAASVRGATKTARLVAFSNGAKLLNISRRSSIPSIVAELQNLQHGGTNMSSAFELLLDKHVAADVVVGITDNESWAGRLPVDLIRAYREQFHPKAIFLVTIAPYGDSIAPIGEAGVYQIGGWGPDVGNFIQRTLAFIEEGIQGILSFEIPSLAPPKDKEEDDQ